MKRRAAIFWAAILSIGAAIAAGPARAAETPPDHGAKAQTETLKERLSDKASDDQRVNNCHVPPEKRGPRKRPVDCPGGPPPPSSARAK